MSHSGNEIFAKFCLLKNPKEDIEFKINFFSNLEFCQKFRFRNSTFLGEKPVIFCMLLISDTEFRHLLLASDWPHRVWSRVTRSTSHSLACTWLDPTNYYYDASPKPQSWIISRAYLKNLLLLLILVKTYIEHSPFR